MPLLNLQLCLSLSLLTTLMLSSCPFALKEGYIKAKDNEAGITTQLLDSSRVSSASSCIDVVSSLWILATLSCDVCRASLVTDAVAVPFDQSYHLLELRNNGGLMIPSKGTVKVVRAAERAIRQHSPGKAPDEVVVAHFVREEIGTEDVFALGSHVQESQFGIDNHLSLLLSLVTLRLIADIIMGSSP
ncbi:unnamed protein product [Arctogadus glacialis]